MPFKLNISENGKAWKIESTSELLSGKSIGETLQGNEISAELEGYELKITGASDTSGFPHTPDVDGPDMKRVLLTKGWGMWKKPRKGGKKKSPTPRGLRLRKTVRGKQLSDKTSQINLIVVKAGKKALEEIFPDQNKPKEKKVEAQEATQVPVTA